MAESRGRIKPKYAKDMSHLIMEFLFIFFEGIYFQMNSCQIFKAKKHFSTKNNHIINCSYEKNISPENSKYSLLTTLLIMILIASRT